MNDVRWNYSPLDADRLVRHFQVTPTRDTIALADINWKASLENQNRPEDTVDGEHVKNIATSMANGELIDAAIVRRNGRGLYFLDGNHRGKAAEAVGETDLDVWFVDCPDDTADIIARLSNIGRHGKPITTAHRVAMAIQLTADGTDSETVCQWLGISAGTLTTYKQQHKAARKIGRTLGSGHKTPSRHVARAVSKLEDDELKILGPELLKSKPAQLGEWVDRIVQEKPKNREAMTHQIRGEMLAQKSTAKVRSTALTEARRGLSLLAKNLRRAMDEAPKKDTDRLYDQIHALYLTAQSARAGNE